MSNRILIVDDDPVQRRLLKAAAERAGYEAELFEHGRSALARLNETGPKVDAVVLDLMMPEMDGLQLLEHMRTAGMSVPVIVQTGQGGIETVVKAMRAGAFDFVVKPVSPERLLSSLANALKASRTGLGPKFSRKGPRLQGYRCRKSRNGTGHLARTFALPAQPFRWCWRVNPESARK